MGNHRRGHVDFVEKMAPDYHLPAKRRSELLRLVRARGQVTVAEFAALFDVSLDTVRRDLDSLAKEGSLTRTHGGAVAAETPVVWDTPLSQRQNTRKDAKKRIGTRAAALIVDGETLFVNGGSTTLAFAQALHPRRNLTVITNNLLVPAALPAQCVSSIYVLGGHYRAEQQVTIGAVGFAGVGSINADTAIISVGGITGKGGLSTSQLAEAEMMAKMIELSRRVIVVADASKFGYNAFAHLAPLNQVHVLVTDAEPPADITAVLDESKVELLVV